MKITMLITPAVIALNACTMQPEPIRDADLIEDKYTVTPVRPVARPLADDPCRKTPNLADCRDGRGNDPAGPQGGMGGGMGGMGGMGGGAD